MKKTIESKTCRNCKRVMYPHIDDFTDEVTYPKNCRNQKCKSPYWDKPRIR